MTRSIVFVANGFTKKNIRLQPWRYVYEIACSRAKNSNVFVITEGSEEKSQEHWQKNLTVIETSYHSVKKQKKLKELILSLDPCELWWSTTPRTLAFYPLLSSIKCKTVAFMTCPLYSWTELFKSLFAKVPFHQTKALWQQRFAPRFMFRWMLNRSFIDKVFVQSEKNKNIIEAMGVYKYKIKLIPVGVDKEDMAPVDQELINQLVQRHTEIKGRCVYLYFGALRPIRGFDSLLDAFPEVIKKNPKAHLIVLARGASEQECEALKGKLEQNGLADNVSVVGGWLSRPEVWSYIDISDVAVLPFILVPSDIPIAVLEAMARGKPVVVSSVDGLPEMARGRGVIVDPLNKSEFSEQLYLLSIDDERRKILGQSAQTYMDTYPCWEDVGNTVEQIM